MIDDGGVPPVLRGIAGEDTRSALRWRLQREGRLVVPEPPRSVPKHEELVLALHGVRVSDLLEEERGR